MSPTTREYYVEVLALQFLIASELQLQIQFNASSKYDRCLFSNNFALLWVNIIHEKGIFLLHTHLPGKCLDKRRMGFSHR